MKEKKEKLAVITPNRKPFISATIPCRECKGRGLCIEVECYEIQEHCCHYCKGKKVIQL